MKFPRLSALPAGARSIERFPVWVSAALGLALALQLVLPAGASLSDAVAAAPRLARIPAAPVVSYPQILERPVFAPDRKPVEESDSDDEGIGDYEVLGIAISAERASVVLRGPDGKTQRIQYGAELAGWKLASVDRSQIVFEKDGQRQTLTLQAKPAAGHSATTTQTARVETDDDDDDTESDQ